MATVMSTGQITLVDLTDQRPVSFYLQADKSKIQVFDVNNNTYSPNYEIENLVITPYFFFGNEDNTDKLNSTNLIYTINGAEVGQFIGASQSGNRLTIVKNINSGEAPFNTNTLKIIATITENTVTDSTTGITIEKPTTADIEFAKVDTGLKGENGKGISDVNQLYKLSDSSTSIVAPTETNLNGWSEQNPEWGNGTQYLWICTETIYTDGSKSYSTPYTDNNWKTAVDAVKDMEDSFGTLKEQVNILQNEVDSAIETWYLEGNPNNLTQYPWYEEGAETQDDPENHIGDLYYDIVTGYSYRFFKNEDGTFEWIRISDSDVTKALEEVSNLQTVVDGKVTIYYDDTEPKPSDTVKLNIDDLWMPENGNFYKWDGSKWVLANEVIDRIEVQYNKNQSNTDAPTEDDLNWSTTTPEWEEGYYIWQRTVTYYREDSVGTKSTPTCISVAGAKGENGIDAIFAIVESTSGKVIFTDDDEEDITLTAKLYIGGVEQTSDVTYNWTSIPTGITGTGETLIVQRSNIPSARSFRCEITYDGKSYSDSIAISDKTDPIYCVIESSNGDKFTNNQISTTLTCRVFDSNGEVDTGGTIYSYNWEKYDKDGNKDTTWTKITKIITIGPSDIKNKATFTCSVTK